MLFPWLGGYGYSIPGVEGGCIFVLMLAPCYSVIMLVASPDAVIVD